MSRVALIVVALVAALPATARAGGWATVEVEGPPAGLGAGEPWRAELLVKQHGMTPLDGATPSIRIDNGAGVTRTFRARPAGRAGTYVAMVTYPTPGTWRTRIFDGFTDALPHRLSPVVVAAAGDETASAAPERPPLAAAADDGPPWPQIAAIAVVALGFAAGFAACGPSWHPRRRRAAPPRYVPSA